MHINGQRRFLSFYFDSCVEIASFCQLESKNLTLFQNNIEVNFWNNFWHSCLHVKKLLTCSIKGRFYLGLNFHLSQLRRNSSSWVNFKMKFLDLLLNVFVEISREVCNSLRQNFLRLYSSSLRNINHLFFNVIIPCVSSWLVRSFSKINLALKRTFVVPLRLHNVLIFENLNRLLDWFHFAKFLVSNIRAVSSGLHTQVSSSTAFLDFLENLLGFGHRQNFNRFSVKVFGWFVSD